MMNDATPSQPNESGPRHRSPGRRGMRDALRARERMVVPGHRLVAIEQGFELLRRAMPKQVRGGWNRVLSPLEMQMPRAVRRALAAGRPLRKAERAVFEAVLERVAPKG